MSNSHTESEDNSDNENLATQVPSNIGEARTWDYPDVSEKQPSTARTNALNIPLQWKYEPPEEVETLTPLTAEDLEVIRQAAYEDGFEQGKKDGYPVGVAEGQVSGLEQGLETGKQQGFDEGKADGETQAEALMNQWQSLMAVLHSPIAKQNHDVEQELLILATKIARAVITRELTTQPDLILKSITDGLSLLPVNENEYHISMSPDDHILVARHFSEQQMADSRWHIIEDPNLLSGGCEISCRNNAVDLSIEKRLTDVIEKFLFDQGLKDDPRAD